MPTTSGRPSRRASRRPVIEEDDSEDELSRTATDEGDDADDFTPAPPTTSRGRGGARGRPRRSSAVPTTTDDNVVAETPSAAAPVKAPARRGRPKKTPVSRSAAAAVPTVEPSIMEDTVLESTEAADGDSPVVKPDPEASAPKPLSRKRKAPTGRGRRAASTAVAADTTGLVSPAEASAVEASETPIETPSTAQSTETPVSAAFSSMLQPPSATLVRRSPTPRASTVEPLVDSTSNANTQPAKNLPEDAAVKPIRPLDTVLERPMDIVLKARTMGPPVVEDTGPRARIVITYLILTNFKSYAGRQEVGPFHASFSSVVGPNGSGKSNVIDSLLFVFGFRASKMRQGKISALIHNSAAYSNLDYCEVAVHFQEVMDQPGGTPQILPGTELIISRRAFKNNSSKYYLDGKESNFTTVTTLLREKGVDLDHKRFLILQGEVESIAQMKPKAANEHDDGLLEYLEDIIGTSKYKTPIEESATEVETLNEVCVEKNGRVQHVEKERNNLEDKKNKAVAYVNDENELAMKRSALWQIYVHELQANLAVTAEAIEQMQAQLNVELEKHQGSEAGIKKLEKMFAKGSKILEAKDKETSALVKEVAKFEQERVKFDEKKKFLADKRKKLERTIAAAEKSATEAESTIEQCTEEIERRAGEIASLEEQVKEEEARLTTIRDSLKGKTQAFSDQIAVKQKSLEPWTEKINQKQSSIAVAESELKILEEKANAGAVALRDMETKVVAIEDGRAAKTRELAECEAKRAELEQEATEVESELRQLSEQEPRVRQKVSNARQKADEARSNLSASQTQGNVLTALMRMRESGRIDGFHGRLGNLGAIDEMYDVAISTACSALDNFVTDTVEAGQQCVEYLRRNNLGRGNFICLDKLRTRDMSPIQTPEKAPRLFDLVKPKDDRFRPAFYHALQDTLVAKDLAQANRIAYGAKRWRVVTLAGELIDKSGTMSGGGSTVKRGLMSSKLVADVTKEQVAKLETDLEALETKFQEFQEHLRDLETRLRELRDEIPRLDTRMQKIRLETEAATRNLADAHKRIKDITNKGHQPSAADDSRASVLKKEIAKLAKEVTKLHGETASVEDEIKSLQTKIMESGGEKLRTQRARVDELKAEVAAHNEETSNAEVRKAKAEKQKVKLEKDHAKATKELQTSTAELERLDSEIESQGEKAEQLVETVAEAKEQLAVMRKELNELKEELDEKTAELNATKAVEIEMRNKLEESQKTYADTQKQLRNREQKLAQLALQNIDELTGVAGSAKKHKKVVAEAGEQKEGEEDEEKDEEKEEKEGEEEEEGENKKVKSQDEDAEMQEDADVEMGEADAPQEEDADEDIDQPFELPKYTPDELSGMSKDKLKAEIATLEERTSNASVDLGVLAEYRRRVEEHAARSSDLTAAVTQRDAAKRRCDDLRRLRLEGFMEGFSAISLRLKEMYQMITMGGNAELELVDSLDPFSEGILFSVMPPKKSWKNISNLSGGEKTLSSLALVFALHHYKPTPLYVMDEIDAALDFRNVSIVANYIKERTKNAQFIVISLRNNMFELAARLVGVYKVNHMTKSVTIENRDFIIRPHQQQVPQIVKPEGMGMGIKGSASPFR